MASIPLNPGSRKSISVTSGWCSSKSSTAWSPLPVSATFTMSG